MAGQSLRGLGVAVGCSWVLAWSVAAWWMMSRVAAADASIAATVVPADWVTPLAVLVMAVVGGLVVLRDRRHRYGWLLFGFGIGAAPLDLLGAYAVYARYVTPDADPPFALLAAWLQDVGTWPEMAVIVLLVPGLFPDGRVVAGAWGKALRLAVASWVAWTLLWTFAERPLENWLLELPGVPANPTGFLAVPPGAGEVWWLVNMVGSAVIALGSLSVRWRSAEADLRQRIKWPLAGLVLLGLFLLGNMADEALVHVLGIDLGLRPVIDLVGAGAIVVFAVTLGLGVLRYRLYDVDRVINRTLVYGMLTFGVFAVYVFVVFGVGSQVPAADAPGLALGATALIAVAFEPARRRLQVVVNRLMFGQRDEPYRVLSRMGDVMAESGAPEDALRTVVETIATSLKLPWVAIELEQRDGHLVRTEHGSADVVVRHPLSLPLIHGEEEVGRLVVAARSERETLTSRDRQVLGDVAHQASAIAATARLTQDLQRSREGLVLAREEERRRIRRDLHDGLGPSLAAQTLALDAAADRVADDPAVRAVLLGLKRDTQMLVAEIRRIVHELRPPALDDLGLAGALVSHVAYLDGTGSVALRIRTEPDPLPELSAAVEVAAWRIAHEAITNVLRHAQAGSCTVTLLVNRGDLHVRVEDDGIGLPVVPRPGIGLTSMRERAEELGGTFSAMDGPDGGTEVVAVLPVGGSDPMSVSWQDHAGVAGDG